MVNIAIPEVSSLEALTDAQFECKLAGRHLMRIVEVEHYKRPRSIGYRVVFHCQECGRFRFDVISPLTGDLLSRSYPEDGFYRWTGERVRINDLRLAKLSRMGIPVGAAFKEGKNGVAVRPRTSKPRRLSAVK